MKRPNLKASFHIVAVPIDEPVDGYDLTFAESTAAIYSRRSTRYHEWVSVSRRVPKQARSRAKVERILASARSLLASEGATGFNTNRIARDAGVGVGSLYEYFPNKQAIIHRLIEDVAAAESSAVLAHLTDLEDAPLPEVIDAIVAMTVELYDQNHDFLRQLWAMTDAERTVGNRPGERAIVADMERRIAPIATELGIVDLELTCFTAFHMVESLAARMAAQGRSWPAAVRSREISRAVKRYLGLPVGGVAS